MDLRAQTREGAVDPSGKARRDEMEVADEPEGPRGRGGGEEEDQDDDPGWISELRPARGPLIHPGRPDETRWRLRTNRKGPEAAAAARRKTRTTIPDGST